MGSECEAGNECLTVSLRLCLSDKTLLYTPVRGVRCKVANSCRNSRRGLQYGRENELHSHEGCNGLAKFGVYALRTGAGDAEGIRRVS